MYTDSPMILNIEGSKERVSFETFIDFILYISYFGWDTDLSPYLMINHNGECSFW